MNNNLLIHAIINQLEADFEDGDFDSMDGMLSSLIRNPKTKDVLISYLGDSCKESWIENKIKTRY